MNFTIGYVNSCFKEDDKMTDLTVENKAREILEKSGLNQSVPLDPIEIARRYGIEVKNAIFKSENICGILYIKDKTITIYVNKNEPNNRKRFIIAHELGHYFLHHLNDSDSLVVEYRTNSNNGDPKKEKEASCFAAALLMDEILVKSLWNDLKSVQAVAEIFQVSYEAMSYRLSNLALLSSIA